MGAGKVWKAEVSGARARRRSGFVALLAALVLALPLQAAPPPGKGEGKGGGGGGGDGGGAQPEVHFAWRVKLDGPYSAVRPAVGADATVYAVDVHDNLYAVAPDGTLKWKVAEAGSKGLDIGPDGTIYTGNENWIKAFNPDGSLKWSYTQSPRAFVLVDVAVGPDANVYAVASSGMGVFSLADHAFGPQLRWTTPEIYGRPFTGYTELAFGPTADGQDWQLYFYANGHTRAVRLSDGAPIFTLGGGNTQPRVSPFDGSWHRGDSAYDPDGGQLWFFDFPVVAGTREPSLAADGTHYAVNWGTALYAIDPAGVEQWHTTLDEWVSRPDVDPSESMVVLNTQATSTHPGALKAVGTGNGSALWRMEFPADETGLDQFIDSGAAFAAGSDRLYVMTAIAGGGTGLSRSYLNAVDTDPALPSASTQLRSAAIALSAKSRRRSVNFAGEVTVMDENRGLVSGASVAATWTLPDGSSVEQTTTTSGSGIAKFSVSGEGGLYSLTVKQMSKDGYVYDERHSEISAAKAWF